MALDAPNLTTIVLELEAGKVLFLPHDRNRTYFSLYQIGAAGGTDVRIWIGVGPDRSVSNWPALNEVGNRLPEGVAGPLFIASFGNNSARLACISSQIEFGAISEINPGEQPGITELAVKIFLTGDNDAELTGDGGELLYGQ